MLRPVVPEGSNLAAAASFLTEESTSAVGIPSLLTAAWASVPPEPVLPESPEPHAVSSSAAEVTRAKGMKWRLRGREGVLMAYGSPEQA